MKSGMPLREFRKITKFRGNNLFALIICVYRPTECVFEPSVMYFNIGLFYTNCYNVVLLDLKNTNFKQNV